MPDLKHPEDMEEIERQIEEEEESKKKKRILIFTIGFALFIIPITFVILIFIGLFK